MYLNERIPAATSSAHSNLLKQWIQLVLVLLASYSCSSRIIDHRHHSSDVVVGAVLGSLMGFLSAVNMYTTLTDSGGNRSVELDNQMENGKISATPTSNVHLISSELVRG